MVWNFFEFLDVSKYLLSTFLWIQQKPKQIIYIPKERWNQEARDIETMLAYRWPTVYDAGPTLNQQCFNVSCLLGMFPQLCPDVQTPISGDCFDVRPSDTWKIVV